jgi:hypothetical protein
MATRIEVSYNRQFTDAVVNDILARAVVTLNVLKRLGDDYQRLPGYAVEAYQADVNGLETDVAALDGHLRAILPLLESIDAKAGPLDAQNKNVLRALQGLLSKKPEASWLDQITGPTPQGNRPAPPPTPSG